MANAAATSIGRPLVYRTVAQAWQQLHCTLFDDYRPELHYMRGPGPKSREKNGIPTADRSSAVHTR